MRGFGWRGECALAVDRLPVDSFQVRLITSVDVVRGTLDQVRGLSQHVLLRSEILRAESLRSLRREVAILR